MPESIKTSPAIPGIAKIGARGGGGVKMPEGIRISPVISTGTARAGAPWGFLFLSLIVHVLDVFARYGILPINIKAGNIQAVGNPWIWSFFLLPYGILFVMSRNLECFKNKTTAELLAYSIIAYLWGPFWSMLPGFFPTTKFIAALLLLLAPFWMIILLFSTQTFPKLSLVYSIFWLFIIMFALLPQVKEFAQEKGYPLPDSLTPSRVLEYGTERVISGTKTAYQYFFVKAPQRIAEEFERAIAQASGDYYTGQVDVAAKKRLGVFLENFRTAETSFYEDSPVSAYATLKAETLDQPLQINVECLADDNITGIIRPTSSFEVTASDQFDIDCFWKTGTLAKGSHTLKLRATFDFLTRAYINTYLMSRERLREYRRQGIDPLEGIADKNPVAVYTSGPVRIGMSFGQQPITPTDNKLPAWAITIENAWEGKVSEITSVILMVPEGITLGGAVAEGGIETVGIQKINCEDLEPEMERMCIEIPVNVYKLTEKELEKKWYKNLTVKNIRLYPTIDVQKVIGKEPLLIRNFKAVVKYKYVLERELGTTVEETITTPVAT